MERLNRQFADMADMQRFATALMITYLASTDRLSICNAGHPRPLFYHSSENKWSVLAPRAGARDDAGNLPLGLDEATLYQTFDLTLGPGDLAVFYTDALTEAADPSGKLLGEAGLIAVASELDLATSSPATIGAALLSAVARHRGPACAEDDVTMIVLHHNAAGPRRLSVAQKVDVYAKVFGLKSV